MIYFYDGAWSIHMGPQDVIQIVRSTAKSQGVDPDLAQAIAMKESKCLWPLQSSRFEPGFKDFLDPDAYALKNGISSNTEIREQATSWGPMHVMGSVARECGFNGPIPLLFTPEIGVFYAVKKLKKLCDKYESESAVIASYNAGSPRKIPAIGVAAGARYVNQDYVNEVTATLTELRAKV